RRARWRSRWPPATPTAGTSSGRLCGQSWPTSPTDRRSVRVASEVAVERLEVSAYEVPTDQPESDGTLEWDSTTLVLVRAEAGGESGLGYTYADAAAGQLVEGKLADVVKGH